MIDSILAVQALAADSEFSPAEVTDISAAVAEFAVCLTRSLERQTNERG